MAVVEPSFFHVLLWMLASDVLVFLAAAYQLLNEMPTRERGEVTLPYFRCKMTISIYTSHQTQSLLGQVHLLQVTKQVGLAPLQTGPGTGLQAE